jgi:TonB family protein
MRGLAAAATLSFCICIGGDVARGQRVVNSAEVQAVCAPESVIRLLPPTVGRFDSAYPTCAVDRPASLLIKLPDYPTLLRRGDIEGSVVLEVVVDTLGTVEAVRELRTNHALFTAAAVNAAEHWAGSAAVLHHRPVRSRIEYTFMFSVHCADHPPRPTANLVVVCG